MRHIKLTNKKGHTILLHVDQLQEAFKAPDGVHTICILKIKRLDGGDTVVHVRESVGQIEEQLKRIIHAEPEKK